MLFRHLQSNCVGDGGNDHAAGSSPQPIRPRDTLVQDYLGREGAEQFLSDWDEERSSTSSLFSSPPSDDDDDDDGDTGAALVAPERVERVQPQPPSPPLPLPLPPLLPPEGRFSLMGGSPPSISPGQQHADTPERRADYSAVALTTSCLDDPSLEKWASSMVALGKAARVEAGVGTGAGEAATQRVVGGGLAAVVATTEPRPASETPGFRDLSRSGSHCSSRALEGDGNSSVPQVDGQGGHQQPDRQRHEQKYRALICNTSPVINQARGEEIDSTEGDSFGDFSVQRHPPSRTTERKAPAEGPIDDGIDAAATSRVTETPMPAGSSSSPRWGSELHETYSSRDNFASTNSGNVDTTDGGGRHVGDGASVGVCAGIGGGSKEGGTVQEDPGWLERKVCLREDESVVAAVIPSAVVVVEKVEPNTQPQRSLLDLADQSIDDI